MTWSEWRILADDETRWINNQEKGLLKAEYLHDYVLRLWFEEDLDISIYELDFHPLFVGENPGGVFEALREVNRFQMVKGEYALIWPNPETGDYDEKAIDLAPECVRFFCEKYGKRVKGSQAQQVA